MKEFIDGFKGFVMRGNVLDLAVAFIIGAAFKEVVQSFADNILLALVAAIVGEPTFDSIILELGDDGNIFVGAFIGSLVNFAILAFAIYTVVKSFETLQARRAAEEATGESGPTDSERLASIDDSLKKLAKGA